MNCSKDEHQEKRMRADEKSMRNNAFNKTLIVILVTIIVFVGVCNVQVFLLVDQLNTVTTALCGDTTHSELPVSNIAEGMTIDSAAALELQNMCKIDDFLEPSLWVGSQNGSNASGSLNVSGGGELVETYRKYDGFLDLQSYLYLDASATGVENFDWITLYLMEDMSYANYYECNLMPFFIKGNNKIIINKKDFMVGSGKPDWDKLSTLRIAYGTTQNSTATLTIGEISTYSAPPICTIWFDDGWKSTYTHAYPLMKEKGFAGVLSVISSHVGYENFCSDAHLHEMYGYGWDYVNHTHTHPDLTELDSKEAELEISTCFDYLYKSGFTRACNNFVPPICATNERVNKIIEDYAQTSRPNWEDYNYLPIVDPMNLSFWEVRADVAPERAFEWIDEAIENDLWLVLLFHDIDTPADASTKYTLENFKKIINYLNEKQSQIEVVTLSQVQDAQIIENSPGEDIEEIDNQEISVGGANAEYKLVWEDTFDENTLNEDSWNALDALPFKNNELQTYRRENIKVEDGFLKIISENQSGYYSGAVTTNNKQLFRFGKIEIKARLPGGKGIFPAFWMLPQSGKDFPEVDIIEFLGNKPNEVWHVFHYEDIAGKQRAYQTVDTSALTDDFHVYALEWTEDRLTWLIDGEETFSVDTNVPSEKMYLYLNTAIGGNWPGNPDRETVFPAEMVIDYVKYYSKD